MVRWRCSFLSHQKRLPRIWAIIPMLLLRCNKGFRPTTTSLPRHKQLEPQSGALANQYVGNELDPGIGQGEEQISRERETGGLAAADAVAVAGDEKAADDKK